MDNSRNVSFATVLASVAVGFFVDIKCFNYILIALLNTNEESGFMSTFYVLIAGLLIAISYLQRNKLSSINKYVLFIVALIFLWYQYTSQTIATPRVPFLFLCVFTITAFVIPSMVSIDAKTFIKSVMLWPVIGVFYISRIFSIEDSDTETISIQVSYAFLVPVIATIVYLKNYYSTERPIQKLIGFVTVLVNLIFCYKMVSYGSRGPFLCIVTLILYYAIFKKSDGYGVTVNKNKTILFTSGFMLVSSFLIEFLSVVSGLLHALGINLNVIDKSLRKVAESGDITNGRDFIYGIATDGILDRPIFGHGMDQFENNTGIVYPHNFILQVLYDGGIVFFSILLVPLLVKLIKRIRTCNYEEYSLIPFFFFISVPGALLSADLWYVERLWLFFGVLFATNFVKSREV